MTFTFFTLSNTDIAAGLAQHARNVARGNPVAVCLGGGVANELSNEFSNLKISKPSRVVREGGHEIYTLKIKEI